MKMRMWVKVLLRKGNDDDFFEDTYPGECGILKSKRKRRKSEKPEAEVVVKWFGRVIFPLPKKFFRFNGYF